MAPCRLMSLSPRLEPSATTARRIGRISPVRVSASTMCGLGVSVTVAPHCWAAAGARSGDRQRYVGERRLDGGSGLVHRDPAPFHTVVRQADVRDALGQGFDEVDRI